MDPLCPLFVPGSSWFENSIIYHIYLCLTILELVAKPLVLASNIPWDTPIRHFLLFFFPCIVLIFLLFFFGRFSSYSDLFGSVLGIIPNRTPAGVFVFVFVFLKFIDGMYCLAHFFLPWFSCVLFFFSFAYILGLFCWVGNLGGEGEAGIYWIGKWRELKYLDLLPSLLVWFFGTQVEYVCTYFFFLFRAHLPCISSQTIKCTACALVSLCSCKFFFGSSM